MNIQYWAKIGIILWILVVIFNIFKRRFWDNEKLECEDEWG